MSRTKSDALVIRGVNVTEHKDFSRISRRELKLSPVLVASAVLIPKLRDPLLKAGLALSDAASQVLFRRRHLAETFKYSQLAPLESFLTTTTTCSIPRSILQPGRLP